MTPDETASVCTDVLDQVERMVIGKRPALQLMLLGMLAAGHILIEDLPGLGKTLAARSFATVLGLQFTRIQFTPDLLPADVTGASIFDQKSGELVFRPGPVFSHLILADEINRTPPKTQSALLEAMQEGQVTTDGTTRPLPAPFIVLATENPIEYEGTYPLPEAQLDRFALRVRLGYLSTEEEAGMLQARLDRGSADVKLRELAGPDLLLEMRESVEEIHVAPDVVDYVARLLHASRNHPQVSVGASPRGGLALLQVARACALFDGRDFVLVDDIKRVAPAALAHRLVLRPELWVNRVTGDDIVAELLAQIPAPATDDAPAQVRAASGR